MNPYQRFRVLYVDDNSDSFEMLRVMLEMSQIEVTSAPSVAQALKRAGSEQFDLYLLDTGLPDGSGVSLCRTLRAVDPQVPVLFYSGKAHQEDIELGLSAGAAGYITKPNSDKLAETIVQLVTLRQKQRPSGAESCAMRAA